MNNHPQAKNWTLATISYHHTPSQLLHNCSYPKVSFNTIDHFCTFKVYISKILRFMLLHTILLGMWIYFNLFIHSTVNGHLCCFQVRANKNNAMINFIWIFGTYTEHISAGYLTRSASAGLIQYKSYST